MSRVCSSEKMKSRFCASVMFRSSGLLPPGLRAGSLLDGLDDRPWSSSAKPMPSATSCITLAAAATGVGTPICTPSCIARPEILARQRQLEARGEIAFEGQRLGW